MEQGWVKLYRKIEHNDFLMTDNSAFIIFTKLLMWVDKDRGVYRVATRVLANRLHMPHGTVYKALRRLEGEGIISIEPFAHFSKIWISNWTAYQSNTEIDKILEHNAPLRGKRSEKRILQGESLSKETGQGTQGKRTGNARGTYNKNKELRIKNSNSNELELAEPVQYGKPEINELFDFWEQTVGYPIKSKIKANRNAAQTLITRHGVEGVRRFITWASMAHSDRFATKQQKISDFISLRENDNHLYLWAKGKAGQQSNETARFA